MSNKSPGGIITAGADIGHSVYFDGTGDYLTVPSSTDTTLGTGDWTIEFWFNLLSFPASTLFFHFLDSRPASTNGFYPSISVTDARRIRFFVNSVAVITTTNPLLARSWYHLALCKSSNSTRLFLNGVQTGSTYADTNDYLGSTIALAASSFNLGNNPLTGYMSNLRIVKGTALYTSTFAPPTQLQRIANTSLLTLQSPTIIDNSNTASTITIVGDTKVSTFTPFGSGFKSGASGFDPSKGSDAGGVWTIDQATSYQNNRQWPIYDPYFNHVHLLIHGGSTSFITDTSRNKLSISGNISANLTTTGVRLSDNNPFNSIEGGSAHFTGTPSNLLVANTSNVSSAPFFLSTGDYTVDLWMYPRSFAANSNVLYWANLNALKLDLITDGSLRTSGGTAGIIAPAGSIVGNTWSHVVIQRASGNNIVFVNGTRTYANTTGATANIADNFLMLGSSNTVATSGYYNGFISNLRVVKGTAVYPNQTTITVPTEPLKAVANTSLLSLQTEFGHNNNMIVDSSPNKFPVTRFNNGAQGSFSPFARTGWSLYMNYKDASASDYLYAPSSTNYSLAAGNWTIEFWYHATFLNTNNRILDTGDNSLDTSFVVNTTSAGVISFGRPTAAQGCAAPAGTIEKGKWYHVVCTTTAGGTATLYINGVAVKTQTGFAIPTGTANQFNIGRGNVGSAGWSALAGYISNVRFVSGQQLYTSNFIPDTKRLSPTRYTRDGGLTYQPITGKCQLLTCQDSTFVDNSINNVAMGIASSNGHMPQMAAVGPFPAANIKRISYGTIFKGGTNEQYTLPSSNAHVVYDKDFTIESWIHPTAFVAAGSGIIGRLANLTSASFQSYLISLSSTGNLQANVNINGIIRSTATTTPISLNTWYHVAFVRNSNTFTLYVNGSSVGTPISNTLPVANILGTQLTVGSFGNGSSPFNGVLSDVRVVNGTAVYTSNFTPPTEPLTVIPNTVLLTCQSPTVSDNSSNALPITCSVSTVGNTKPTSTIVPFEPSVDYTTIDAAYDPNKVGGSILLDGTGDYLTVPFAGNITSHPKAFDMGDTPWTYESWIFPLSNPATNTFFGQRTSTATFAPLAVSLSNTSANLTFVGSTDNITSNISVTGTSGRLLCNSWNHIAITHNTTHLNGYVNGVLDISTAQAPFSSNANLAIGASETAGTNVLKGYIGPTRFIKKQAVYSGVGFVVPDAPFTSTGYGTFSQNITGNVSLLMNFGNAGIYDSSGKINMETVAEASSNSTISKVSTSSIYFDGGTDILRIPQHSIWAGATGGIDHNCILPGPFTIESWLYPVTGTGAHIFGNDTGTPVNMSGNYYEFGVNPSANTMYISVQNPGYNGDVWTANTWLHPANVIIQQNAWSHVAVSRNENNEIFFHLNGQYFAGGGDWPTGNKLESNQRDIQIGINTQRNFMSNLRLTKGVARYNTANFTPQTTMWQNQ